MLLNFLEPQISAKAALRVFGAKRPIFFAFALLIAFFEPALRLRRTCARFAACARNDGGRLVFLAVVVTFFVVAFFVVAFVMVFFVVAFVISSGGLK